VRSVKSQPAQGGSSTLPDVGLPTTRRRARQKSVPVGREVELWEELTKRTQICGGALECTAVECERRNE